MGFYDLLADKLAAAGERVDVRVVTPLRRRWRETLRIEPNRSTEAAWDDSPWEHARRRRRGIVVTLAVLVAVVFGVALVARSVVSAASNYAAGKQALAAGRYEEAADKLASAKILAILPYADADSLYKQARELSDRAAATVQQLQAKADQAAQLYAKANAALREHRYGDAIRLYRRVLALSPAYADTQIRLIRAERQQKAERLLARARVAFAHHDWKLAAQRTEQLLTISPRYPGAKKLYERAVLRERLQPVFGRAVAQANAGHWKRARRLVGQVLGDDPAFPGAHKLLQKIQAAIAAQAAAQAPAPVSTPTPAYTPPAPAYTPPPPAPNPTAPPP